MSHLYEKNVKNGGTSLDSFFKGSITWDSEQGEGRFRPFPLLFPMPEFFYQKYQK